MAEEQVTRFTDFKSSGYQEPASKTSKTRVPARIAAFIVSLAVFSGAAYLGTQEVHSPDFLGTYGVVGNITAALHKQGPHGAFTPALSLLLRYSTTGSPGNQNAALSKGAIPAVNAVLQSNHTGWRQREAVRLLTELTRGNDAVKQAALKEGPMQELIGFIEAGSDKKLISLSAAAIAVLTADNDASRKKKIGAAGAISALYGYLDSGKSSGGKASINAAWALANLVADSSPNQGLLLDLGGSDLLTRLTSSGPDQRITQPSLFAIGNLAAKNTAAQESLQNAGTLEALVRMIETGMADFKSKASEPFHTEVLEHVADLQRRDPNVRSALAEVGGLEELLGLIEAGSEIKSSGTEREKQLVLVEGEDSQDELHSIRGLVRDLQDEVDTEAGLLSDVKLPSLSRGPSGARILQKPRLESRQKVLSTAAWVLGNVIADNTANQDAAREAGAVEALVKLLEGAEDAFVAKGALGAISSLVQGNPTNKLAVREANGIEGLVKLLASNPADKEVLQATAKALKQMATERPAFEVIQRSSSRWLRVLSRQASAFLFERLGLQISPGLLSIAIGVLSIASFLFGFLLVLRGVLGGSRSVRVGKKVD